MSESHKAVAVIGGGAVGSVLAACLADAGYPTFVVDSGERCQQIADIGLVLTGQMNLSVRPAAMLKSIAELAQHADEVEMCFVCTKAWSLMKLLPELQAALSPWTSVVSFQNGIGPEEDMAKFFQRDQLGRAVVNFGSGVEPDGRVSVHWFKRPNYLGGSVAQNSEVFERYAAVLTRAGLATDFVPTQEMRRRVFFRTILNSALNALCASSGITMNQAMRYKHTRALTRTLVQEGLSVGSALGYNYGEDALDECFAYLEAGGDHLPAMWDDLAHKRRTEIEYMNGKIVKLGRMFKNVDVDVNMFFTSVIVTLEVKSGARAADDIPAYLTY